VALFRELGRPQFVQCSLAALALALALTGRPSEARAAIAALDALDLPTTFYWAVEVLEARAWTSVAEGEIAGGRALLEEAVAVGERTGDLVGASAALHGLARLGAAKKVAARQAGLAGEMDGTMAPARAAHARALARDDGPGLEEASTTFEAMGAFLLAAEAAADAAVTWRRRREPRKASAVEFRAARLVDKHCAGASTPALQAAQTRASLTPAERETACLAAKGRTNKEIAEGLCLSVRTVEARLYAIYEKLGISGRSELAAALELPG
jgi:DNA-binding CsgD family transcriptional regulator